MPPGMCCTCAEDLTSAFNFKQLCQRSERYWDEATDHLRATRDPNVEDKTFFIFYPNENNIYSTSEPISSMKTALESLNKPKKVKRKRVSCSCPFCGKKFSCLDRLNEHLKHTPSRYCPECGVATTKRGMAKHLSQKHDMNVTDCSSCHDIFPNQIEAQRHWLKHHGPESHRCRFCGSGFPNERGLRAHTTLHTLFTCSCGTTFENSRCHRHHMSVCDAEKPQTDYIYECDHCRAVYDKKPSLRIHIVQKHLNVLPFVCQTCGKRTSTLTHLKSHAKTHESGRNIQKCHCGAKFRTALGYKLHLRIHSGDKPYKCSLCDENFLSASRRLDHVKRRHQTSREISHSCSECSAKFVRPWELKKHYLNIHGSVVKVEPCKRELMKRQRPVDAIR